MDVVIAPRIVGAGGQQLCQLALEHAHVAQRLQRQRRDGDGPVRVQLDARYRLLVRAFRQRVFQQRARIVDASAAQRLRPVQVAQRDQVEAGEQFRRHGAAAAHRQRPFRFAGRAADHEGMAHHHRAHARRMHRADGIELRAQGGFVRRHVGAGRIAHHGGFGIRQRIDADFAVRIMQAHATGLGQRAASHVQPLRAHQARAEFQPLRAVVVARDHHYRHAGIDHDAAEHVVEQGHRLGRRHGAVIDVAGNQHRIRALVADQFDKLVEEMGLVFQQAAGMEEAAEMPVGGVKETQSGVR
ncbi:protein of unknown function (plasmid) [Cupriavidus taiwanensis]|uniref:Uncharacterized protein n=1 Tax=Cupriavidus taiwanensis TaxID=164546 RepID=A0A9Q7XRG2_9BURK|nr:protein of unknown function [Cupriavidus taiwanensis]